MVYLLLNNVLSELLKVFFSFSSFSGGAQETTNQLKHATAAVQSSCCVFCCFLYILITYFLLQRLVRDCLLMIPAEAIYVVFLFMSVVL